MWYFAWILGVSLAVLLAVLNAMMCEAKECAERFPDEARRSETDPDSLRSFPPKGGGQFLRDEHAEPR